MRLIDATRDQSGGGCLTQRTWVRAFVIPNSLAG